MTKNNEFDILCTNNDLSPEKLTWFIEKLFPEPESGEADPIWSYWYREMMSMFIIILYYGDKNFDHSNNGLLEFMKTFNDQNDIYNAFEDILKNSDNIPYNNNLRKYFLTHIINCLSIPGERLFELCLHLITVISKAA